MADLADGIYRRVLVVRCQVGDQAAFEELVGMCQPRLRGFLFKMLAGREIADDVAQEVWMDVFRDLPRLNDPGAFLPWFYRIAHNRAFRSLRGKRSPAASIEDVEIADESAEEKEFSAEDAQRVHAALDRIAPEYREALLLRFMEQMSYEDIAKVAGCQIGTVRSRIHNGKAALRRIIEKAESQ